MKKFMLRFAMICFIMLLGTFAVEGSMKGKLHTYGVLQANVAGKQITAGVAPIRNNRLYYKVEVT